MKDYTLVVNRDGKVQTLYRTGNDLVRVLLYVQDVDQLIMTRHIIDSDIEGFIKISTNYYFEGSVVEKAIEKTVLENKTSRKAGKKNG